MYGIISLSHQKVHECPAVLDCCHKVSHFLSPSPPSLLFSLSLLTTTIASPLPQSPSSRPLWVVLHDYTATEPGMLSVHEGELVEVMDISRNEWCLVQPSSRQSVEGWVPTAYLKPYDAGGYGKLPELSLHVTRSLCMHLLCVCIYMSLWDNVCMYISTCK